MSPTESATELERWMDDYFIQKRAADKAGMSNQERWDARDDIVRAVAA